MRHITRTITRPTTIRIPDGATLRLALEFSSRMAGNALEPNVIMQRV